MADRMPAEIWIGGNLPRSLLGEFPISDLSLDWDDTRFDATSEEGVLMPATKAACCILPTAKRLGANFRSWKAGCGNTTSPSGGNPRANTNTTLASSNFALTCRARRFRTGILGPLRMASLSFAATKLKKPSKAWQGWWRTKNGRQRNACRLGRGFTAN